MQLLDDEDLGTMMEIWWPTRSENPQPIELFAELEDLEPVVNVSPVSQHHEFDFDLNVGWTDQLEYEGTSQMPKNSNYGGSSYNNPTSSPRLQIHLEVIISTEANVREMTNNDEDSDQDVEDFSDPDVDEVPDDIDDEGPEEVEDVYGPSFSNLSHGIILRNESGGDMLNFEELFIGQQFENKADSVFAIKQYSMKLSIDYKVVKSTPTLYVKEYWRAGEGCGWRVRATFIQRTQQWQIRKLKGCHTCSVARMSQDHRKLDTKNMQARFQCRVSYRKAWLVKQMAMQQLYGDWDESYNELQGWILAMVEYIPRTIVDLQTLPYRGPNGRLELGRRILLIAVAQDGNGNVLPIAFAIIESKNSESWAYFIQNLRRHVVREDNICIISDRSKGLVATIRQSEVPWRFVYCICHIAVNFHNQYKNKDWRKRTVNMGYELEAHRFRHKLARLETDMAGSNPPLRQWLGSMEPWQWAQCFDEGYRYGQMTTNLVEAINSVLRSTRHLPISAVFPATFYRLATLMPKMGLKQAKQLEVGHVYVEKIRDAMKENAERARLMNTELYSRNLETFRVTEYIDRRSGIPPRLYRVDLRNRQCECEMFQTLRYPCAHVVAACATYSLNTEQYIDDVYTLERTLRIWGNEFPVLRDVSTWEVQPPAFEMLPDRSLRRRIKGRPTTTRIQNDMDIREQVDPKRYTICRIVGHSRSKCPHRNVYTGQSSQSEKN
ncbi:uncharacterized protein LOC108478111 [Gossypium arboreum]|uniref:uncharacterized protein LOC108478111 n=1 Tax=Gossypium arboreum TaxID=29729 RepID=UPI00081961E2|nr:uncharacterized protein LOC108478111 [Gossypium arboreum]